MTDLAERLDQSKRERLIAAIRALAGADYRELMISLIGGIGVKVQSAKEDHGALIIHGQGEENYLILASRTDFADPELIARSLLEEARSGGRVAVFMTLQGLDPGTLNFLEKEKVSYADRDKFLSLLEKYGLDQQLLNKVDRKILEDRGEPCLPSVCKLEALIEEAEEARGKGDLSRAVQVLSMALEIKPLNDSLWLKRAEYQLEMGRPADALVSANRAAELRPGDAATWFLIALIQNRLGERDRELTAYDNVLRINPAHAPALLNKGATLFELGRLEWALRIFNEMVQRYPQEPRGWNNRGLVLKSLGRQVEAQASFEKASVLDREFADPLINIARLLEERGDMAAAVEAWKDVLRLVDSRGDIWAHLGACLRDLGNDEDALTALDRALYLEPSMEHIRHERDELARRLGVDEEPAVEERVRSETTSSDAAEPGLTEGVPEERAVQTVEEPGLPEVVPEAPKPTVIDEERAVQTVEEPGHLEIVPEAPKPAILEERRELDVPAPPGPLQLQAEPSEGAAATEPEGTGQKEEAPVEGPSESALPVMEEEAPAVPGPVVQEEAISAPAELTEEAPVRRAKARWEYDVQLPALPAGREDKALQEASLLFAGGEREKALQVVDLALKEGSDLELLRLKARAQLALGRGEDAANTLKEALRHSSNDVRTVLDMEALFHRYGGEGSRLLKGAGDCREARSRLAVDLLEGGDYGELARMDTRQADLPAKHAKALAQMRQGRYREASKTLKAILSEHPAFPEALNNIGVCMRFMGEFDYDQAIHMMELAMQVDPHYSDSMNNIGCTLFAAGHYERALNVLRAAVDEDRRPEYLLNLSNVQMALGQVEGAKESLTTALKMDEGADVLYMLGVIAESEKQHRWALSLYEDALEKAPGFREAQAGRDRVRVLAKK